MRRDEASGSRRIAGPQKKLPALKEGQDDDTDEVSSAIIVAAEYSSLPALGTPAASRDEACRDAATLPLHLQSRHRRIGRPMVYED